MTAKSKAARSSLAYALAAIVLVACVALLFASRTAPAQGSGFASRIVPGARCDGEPRTSVVREPFVLHEDDSAPRCIVWTASLAARAPMHADFEAIVEGSYSVSIDGRVVVADEDAPFPRTRRGAVDLSPGVHSFSASFRSQGGPAYFRLEMDDEREPHDLGVIAPLDDDAFYPTADAARAALASPPRERPPVLALFASLGLALAGTSAWLALRTRRGRDVPAGDLAIAATLFAAALLVRVHALGAQDICWDEGILSSGQHYIRNVLLGDYFPEAWRNNLEHPPLTKWILELGDQLAGRDGARVVVGAMSSIAVAFLFAFGRVAFDRSVGIVAGALAVVLPLWVAHGRIAGHEAIVLFFWNGAMLAFACWAQGRDATSGRGDSLAAFVCVFAGTLGIFCRPTCVWVLPVLAGSWLVVTKGSFSARLRALPLSAIAGGAAALALTLGLWPFLWQDPLGKLARMAKHWTRPLGDIEVYLGKLCLPAWHYFTVAFLSETPALLLALAVAGIAVLFAAPASSPASRWRTWGWVCLLWLVVPFAQSFSTLRIGAGRYVVQAWPALLLLAAIALVALGRRAWARASGLPAGVRALVGALPALVAVASTGLALARVEPYPLDYFNELVGGPAGVAARRMFEIPWWGEGNLAAVRALNAVATHGARVHLALWPPHALERLRDDLVKVDDAKTADYVLVSHLQYFATPPAGCVQIGAIDVEGAPLVDTYHCAPVNPTQLGFAAMTRGAPDEALPLFRDALRRDPDDPAALFGVGWAAQAKGDLAEAEPSYVRAAARAAQTGDLETEYFARFDLGTLYAQEGKNDDAVTAFRATLAVVDRAPGRFADRTWSPWFNLGRALAASGHLDDARAALERARSLRPGESSVTDALKSLPSGAGTAQVQ